MYRYKGRRGRGKKILAGLVVVCALAAGIFLAGRYGWRLLGFSACQGAEIEKITVSDGQVQISGRDTSLVPSGCLGTYYKEEDGKLYVGVRFSGLFGFFELSRFDVTIPTQGKVEEVYLKTGDNAFLIWPEEGEKPISGSCMGGDRGE